MIRYLLLLLSITALNLQATSLEDYLRQEDTSTQYNYQQTWEVNLNVNNNEQFGQQHYYQLKQALSNYSEEEILAHEKAVDWVKNHPEEFKSSFFSKLGDNLNTKQKRLLTDLAYVQVMMAGMIGIIWALPEDVSKWDHSAITDKSMLDKWKENVNKGPVIDHDDWAVNYIGHPLSGSAYYVWGRQRGLNWKEAALLSTAMSTIFWEYGYEAFAEIPSIQDLIFTPLIGSIIGEGAFYLYSKVMENDGKVGNSRILGNIARAVLNPIGELNMQLDRLFKRLGKRVKVNTSLDFSYRPDQDYTQENPLLTDPRKNQSYVGLKVEIKF